ILVIAEHDNAQLKGATLNTIAAAAAIGGDIHVLVAGAGVQAVAEQAASVAGVAKVLAADGPALSEQLAENVSRQVLALAQGHGHVLFSGTGNGKSVAPGVAARLGVAQSSDIAAVQSADTLERPIYAGNAIATVQSADAVKVI